MRPEQPGPIMFNFRWNPLPLEMWARLSRRLISELTGSLGEETKRSPEAFCFNLFFSAQNIYWVVIWSQRYLQVSCNTVDCHFESETQISGWSMQCFTLVNVYISLVMLCSSGVELLSHVPIHRWRKHLLFVFWKICTPVNVLYHSEWCTVT